MIQIIGTKKNRETAKAIRYCKERSLAYQFVDLGQRSLTEGEWRSLFTVHKPHSLIDREGAYYKKEGYEHRIYDAETELVERPQLLKLPILRSRGRVMVGFDPEMLVQWGILNA